MESDRVRWGRIEIPYVYSCSERKLLAITVHPDLRVEVRAPLGTDLDAIRERVVKRGAWIQKAWREFELYLPAQPPRRYINGETHRYLGRQFRLRAEQGNENCVKCFRGYFRVTTSVQPTPKQVKALMEEWYRCHAKRVFHERLAECCKRTSLEGIKRPSVTIRTMRTRWGSCSSKGRVSLNLELVKASKECIDYVILHELCHLKIPSHGPKFWRLMAKLMPDYEERKRKLNLFADV